MKKNLLTASSLCVLAFAACQVPASAQTASPDTPVAQGQTASDPAQTAPTTTSEQDDQVQDIIVTGQRASLEASRAIKRDSDRVVDAIVADDIGKLPDNSVAAALQRVPGVQVSNGFNNEISGPIIRGLGDILTTLNGREIFSGVGRGFAFQDLPAEAVASVEVFKSNTADLIEGGVAGVVNMNLQKPFNFKKGLTVATNLRGYHGTESDKTSFTGGVLVSNRWETGIGDMGLLVDISYNRNNFSRSPGFNCDPRSGNNGPPGGTGIVFANCVGAVTYDGYNTRPQANFSFQWQAAPGLEVYADGLFAGYRARYGSYYIYTDLFSASSITNAQKSDQCFSAPVSSAGFTGVAGKDAVQNLCLGTSATYNNPGTFLGSSGNIGKTDQYVYGGGLRFNRDAVHVNFDLSAIRSINTNRSVGVDVNKLTPQITFDLNSGGKGYGVLDMPGDPLGNPSGYYLANALYQDINKSFSTQWAAKLDTAFDIDSDFLRQFQFGARYSNRFGSFGGVNLTPPGIARTLVSSTILPADFLTPVPRGIFTVNGGNRWYTPNADYLLDNVDTLNKVYNRTTPLQNDPTRAYVARERTLGVYAQGKYEIDFSDSVSLDGLGGVRVTRTSREQSATTQTGGILTPVESNTTNTYVLPNASARLRFDGGVQFRATYAKTLSQPTYGDLNPALNLTPPNGNPNVILTGSGGNPDLRAQISNNFDITAEYYFGRSSYISLAGYYRTLKDRIAPANSLQTFFGQPYRISQPRNVGSSQLKGIEVATQTFFDFLPKGLDGFGVLGNFTLADSKITTPGDPLEGAALLGVSKYAYTAGGLYEKYGITARVVYTWRSGYNEFLFAGGTLVGSNFDNQFNRVKPNGRLDFSVAYDVTPAITVSVDGVNVLHGKYLSYFDTPAFPHDIRVDDTFYGASVRARF